MLPVRSGTCAAARATNFVESKMASIPLASLSLHPRLGRIVVAAVSLLGFGLVHATPLDNIRLVGDSIASSFTVASAYRLPVHTDATAPNGSSRAADATKPGIAAPSDSSRQSVWSVDTSPAPAATDLGSDRPHPRAADDDASVGNAWTGDLSILESSTCALIFTTLALVLRAARPDASRDFRTRLR